jgi:hypothetical protein
MDEPRGEDFTGEDRQVDAASESAQDAAPPAGSTRDAVPATGSTRDAVPSAGSDHGSLRTDRYEPTTAITEHVHARNPRCTSYDCPRTARRCDLDHHEPWPRGPTHVDNIHPRCRRHHELKTRHLVQTSLQSDGSVRTTMPPASRSRRDPKRSRATASARVTERRLDEDERCLRPAGLRCPRAGTRSSCRPGSARRFRRRSGRVPE